MSLCGRGLQGSGGSPSRQISGDCGRSEIGRYLLFVVCCVSFIGSLNAQENPVLEPTELTGGAELAALYCAACHQLPEPDLLTKESWEYALTYMGFYMGIVDYDYMEGSSERAMDSIRAREEFTRAAGMIPQSPILTPTQWKSLRNHYISSAPEKALPQQAKPIAKVDEDWFRSKPTQFRASSAIVSMVHMDEENGLLLVHDSGAQQLTLLDRNLGFFDRHDAPGVSLVDAVTRGEDVYLLSIGDLFASNIGLASGELQYAKSLGGVYIGLKVLVDGLHRPADFELADLDRDGVDELLVSNFGEYTGNFSIYRRPNKDALFDGAPQILSEQAGIVKSAAHDFNRDGRLDIAVLMSNARENVSLFLAKPDGSFEQRILIEQHPSFGYTGLLLRDFDGDRRMDIVTINGDNGDSDPYNTLKRDHGIRVYLNRGDLRFEEAYFYPMYGVFGGVVEDFDLDGDLDIAAIAYHPDFDAEQPETFVLLEQTTSLTFAPLMNPDANGNRWMSMDAGDLDGDGDKDIVLGAANLPVGMMDRHEEMYREMVAGDEPLLFLENLSK